MGNIYAITILIATILGLGALFYYVLVYIPLKPLLEKADREIAYNRQLEAEKSMSLIERHQRDVVRLQPPKADYATLITILSTVIEEELVFKTEELRYHNYYVGENIDDVVLKMSENIYLDLSVSLIHDLEYYWSPRFLTKFITRECRNHITNLIREGKKESSAR